MTASRHFGTAGAVETLPRPGARTSAEGEGRARWLAGQLKAVRSYSLPIAWLLIVAIGAAAAPWLVGDRAFRVDLDAILSPPSVAHPLGTDENGRDLFGRLLWGARSTIGIGMTGALLAVLIGSLVGGLAGYRGGYVDAALMRLVDFALAFPSLFAILLFSALFQTGLWQLVVLLGVTGWMTVARLVRGEVRALNERPYVEAARSLGASGARILLRHLLPNLRQLLVVATLSQISRAVVAEATISFLGMGIQPPEPTWGNLLIGAQDYLWAAPWLALAPGVALTTTLLALFALAEAFR